MTIELPLRGKYLHHQVKKVSPPKGGGSGSTGKKKFKLPNAVSRNPVPATRTRVLTLIDGRRTWSWR